MLHRPQKTVACLALLLTPIPFLLPFSLPSVFSFFDDRVPPTLHFPLSKPGCIYTRLVSLALLHSSLSFTPLHRVGFREGHLAGGNRRRTRTSSAEQAGPEQNPHWARFFPSFTTRVPALPSCDPLLVSNPTFGLLQDEFFPPGNSYPSLSQVLKNRRMLRNRG